jgi:hypothetical protein
MTEFQLTDPAGQKYLSGIADMFSRGVNVPPERAGELSVALGSGRFDRMAGRMLFAARGDINLTDNQIDTIINDDLRTLRINGTPEE